MHRNRKWILLTLGILVLGALVLGMRELRLRYPNQGVFSAERWRDGMAILLGKDIALGRFDPQPTLAVPRKAVPRAAYPAIDIHFHLESLPAEITPDRLIQAMDATGIEKIVHLSGRPETFDRFAKEWAARYPDRIVLFAKPDLQAIKREGGIAEQAAWLRKVASQGARGVKVSKSFGLSVRDAGGKLVAVDDPRFDPIWAEAGKLGLPVLIHTADPIPSFQPLDSHNELYDAFVENPAWNFAKPRYPKRDELMAQLERLVARHPNTIFIGAHMGSEEDNLERAARMLERYPNYYLDMSSRIAALGRQPYTARSFFLKYQDRIIFGSDGGYGFQNVGKWTPENYYRSHFEFLETFNEYIEYPLQGLAKQGNWRAHGIGLPPAVLEKIYLRNAERLLAKTQPSG